MKKIYTAAEMEIVLFDTRDVIVASGTTGDVFVPSVTLEENETEIL